MIAKKDLPGQTMNMLASAQRLLVEKDQTPVSG